MNEYFDAMYTGDYLEHHGILGMKWGIRRFQNKDGSLTSAGKNRYKTDDGKSEEKPKMTRSEKKAAKAEAKAAAEKASLEEAKKNAIATANVDEIIKLSSKMTTEELRDAMTRVTAISTMNKSRLPKEKTTLDKALSSLELVKKGADAVKNAHQSIRQLREEFGLDTKSLIEKTEAKDKQNSQKKSKSDDDSTFKKVNDLYAKFKKDRETKKQFTDLRKAKTRAENDSFIASTREKNSNWINTIRSAGDITSVKLSSPSTKVSSSTRSFFRNEINNKSNVGATSLAALAQAATKQAKAVEDASKPLDDLRQKWLK